jgi:hypothetical protein
MPLLPTTIITTTTTALRRIVLAVSLLATHAFAQDGSDQPVRAGDITPNFQDLSAVLSIFASDTVEEKFLSPRASHWERMSGVWSLFGILGVLRACIKVAAGISGADAIGVNLYGSAAYTNKKTSGASCAVVLGKAESKGPQTWWQDDRRSVLGMARVQRSSFWKRPIVLVIGHTRCPGFGLHKTSRKLQLAVVTVTSIMISIAPLMALIPSRSQRFRWYITVAASAIIALLGTVLPILIDFLTDAGVAALRDTPFDRLPDKVMSTSDTVIADSNDNADHMTIVHWQTGFGKPWMRAGDLLALRVMSAVTLGAIIVYYVFNYMLLSLSSSRQGYIWLGVQVFILAVRYVMWSVRPQLISYSRESVFYLVVGALVINPLAPGAAIDQQSATGSKAEETIPNALSLDLVAFATASAQSKVINGGAPPTRVKLSALGRLAGAAPPDILRAPYCHDIAKAAQGSQYRAIRLPWSFVEELYVAQGLILGDNPWNIGGLFLAAVFSGDQFRGLTTIHPLSIQNDQSHGEDTVAWFGSPRTGVFRSSKVVQPRHWGVTQEGYMVSDLVDGTIDGQLDKPLEEKFQRWHADFRDNVQRCRDAAVSNGPPHCEMHVWQMGDGENNQGHKHMKKRVESLREALEITKGVVKKERSKDHARCRDHCTVPEF